jgi:hypothetical protein
MISIRSASLKIRLTFFCNLVHYKEIIGSVFNKIISFVSNHQNQSMLSKQKKKSIAISFRKDNRKSLVSKRHVNTDIIKTVAVLIEESQLIVSKSIVNMIQQEFKIPSENIHMMVFKEFQKDTEYTNYECTEKDFGWYGSLKLNKLQEFVKKDFDLLINYGFEENLYLNVITLHSKSNFKVGFASKDGSLYDLSVADVKRDFSVLTAEMIKYLKILKKL